MTTLLPARLSISFIIISVGGIVLSIMIASLFVSYNNPNGLSWTINGGYIMDGNQTNVSIKGFSERDPEIAEDDQLSSVDELQELENGYDSVDQLSSFSVEDYGKSMVSLNQTASVAVPPSQPSRDHEKNHFSSVAEVPAFAPALSMVELQALENANTSVSVSGRDSEEPSSPSSDGLIVDSGKVGSGVTASLNQTVSVAALPSPQSTDYEKTLLSSCDLYHGKWVYDHAGPLYTNNTCPILTEGQNCQGNGRPDSNYQNWRWKPSQCEIPRFDGRVFLEMMRGKTLAFVGDSLARNQMESLLCILWQTEVPISHGSHRMHKWHFRSTSTTIVRIWSAWLVRKTARAGASSSPRDVNVHLYTPDDAFMRFIPDFDAIVLSSGHWFTTECTYVLNSTIVRRQLRRRKRRRPGRFDNLIKSYVIALQTALDAIGSIPNYRGLTLLRSYSPEHYMGGAWNTGGSCAGADRPESKSARSAYADAMRKQQAAEVERAARRMRNGSRLRFMDITEMSGYRRDGHAGPYRSKERWKGPEDCVHWCMPGPVDTWNEILFQVLRREI